MSPNRTRVFIVDDSAFMRARLVDLVRAVPGAEVSGEAAAAGSAIAAILATHPEVVLLDLNLEGRSGLEVLREVHTRAPSIEFVVITNHSEPQYRRACARAGATYFLDKSTEFSRVRDVLAEISAHPH